MVLKTSDYIISSGYFPKKEIKKLFLAAGAQRVSKEAIDFLNLYLTTVGFIVTKEALKEMYKTSSSKKKDSMDGKLIDNVWKRNISEKLLENPIIKNLTVTEKETKPLIHYIWLIHQSGQCLLSKSYSGLQFPDAIIAGLLVGIYNMMMEVTGRKIRFIELGDLIIHIHSVGALIVTVISDTKDVDLISTVSRAIAHEFEAQYTDVLEDEIVDLTIFEGFEDRLDELATQSGLQIPTQLLEKIPISHEAALTEEELEDTVHATALKEEIKRASQLLSSLPVFSKGEGNNTLIERVTKELKDSNEEDKIIRQVTSEKKHLVKAFATNEIGKTKKDKNNNEEE